MYLLLWQSPRVSPMEGFHPGGPPSATLSFSIKGNFAFSISKVNPVRMSITLLYPGRQGGYGWLGLSSCTPKKWGFLLINSGKVSLITLPFCLFSFSLARKSNFGAKLSKFWTLTSVEIFKLNCAPVVAPNFSSILVFAKAKHDSKFFCLRGYSMGDPNEI